MVGRRVQITGLTKTPEFNGQWGKALQLPKSWAVSTPTDDSLHHTMMSDKTPQMMSFFSTNGQLYFPHQVENFDFSCKRYAVQLLPVPWPFPFDACMTSHDDVTYITSMLCFNEAEGVPMIVKLRRGLRPAQHSKMNLLNSLN